MMDVMGMMLLPGAMTRSLSVLVPMGCPATERFMVTFPIAKVKTEGFGMRTSPKRLVPLTAGMREMLKEVTLKPANWLRPRDVSRGMEAKNGEDEPDNWTILL